MDDQLPNINFTQGLGPAVVALLAFIVPLAIRTFLKDRREARERATQLHMVLCRLAYNAVQNQLKGGAVIADKQEAGLVQLDKFYVLRTGAPATEQQKADARIYFDALHGELCPGGTGTQPPNAPGF